MAFHIGLFNSLWGTTNLEVPRHKLSPLMISHYKIKKVSFSSKEKFRTIFLYYSPLGPGAHSEFLFALLGDGRGLPHSHATHFLLIAQSLCSIKWKPQRRTGHRFAFSSLPVWRGNQWHFFHLGWVTGHAQSYSKLNLQRASLGFNTERDWESS